MRREEFERYITENQERFYRLAFSYTHNPDAALDVVQESILKGIDKFSTLRNPQYMQTWFYRILVNECVSWFRHNGKTLPLDETALEERGPKTAEDPQTAQTAIMDLHHALEALDPKLRAVVELRFFEDMKLEEIAVIMHMNLSTVKSRLYKALKLLRVDLEEEE